MEKLSIILILAAIHTQSLHSLLKIDLGEIFLILFLLIFLIKLFVYKNETVVITEIQLVNIALCFFLLLSTINADLYTFIYVLLKSSLFILILFFFTNIIIKKNLLGFTLKWFVILTIISSVVAILQEIIYLYNGTLLIGFVKDNLLPFMIEYTSLGPFLRVPAFFGFYQPFIFYLTTSLLIIFNYIIYKKAISKRAVLSILFAFLIIFSAVLLTFSKDALLAITVGLTLSVFIRWPSKIIHFVTSILFILLIVTVSGFFHDIIEKLDSYISFGELSIRIQLAREGIENIFRHSWIGIGMTRSGIYTNNAYGWPPHNTFIQAADELGILGFFAFCSFIGYAFWRALRLNLMLKEHNESTGMCRGLLIGYIAYVISMQFHPLLENKFLWIWIAFIEGAVLLSSKGYIHNDNDVIELNYT